MKTILSLGAIALVSPFATAGDIPQIVWDTPAETVNAVDASAPVETAPIKLVISADALYTAAGDMIGGGTIAIAGSTIAAVTPGGKSRDGGLHVAAITPGFVELSPRINLADLSVEESGEIMPTMRANLGVDLYDKRWERLLNSGTTTVLISPAAEDVVGGLTSVLKTGGEPTVEAREILADATLAGSFGSHASRGNHALRCSSEPNACMGYITKAPCTEAKDRIPLSPRSSSCMMRPYATLLRPAQPYSSGRLAPKKPNSAI